jgi:hypothetical protein
MRPPRDLTPEELAATRGGFDIGGLIQGAFGLAQQAGAPAKELGMAQQAMGIAMPLISQFLGGAGGGGGGGAA